MGLPFWLSGWPVPLLLGLVVFGAYWPSLWSDLVYDARVEILQEGFLTSLSHLPEVLSLKVLSEYLMLGSRPGQLLYLMLVAAINGKAPFGFHLCSNLLHAANVALLFVLLRRFIATEAGDSSPKFILQAQLAAAVGTLLFALHPVVVESVAEVSYSSNLLVTFFTLLALLVAMTFRADSSRGAILMGGLGTACAFAAVTCKESGLAASLVILAYWLLFRWREAKGPWLYFVGSALCVTVLFLVARFSLAPAVHVDYSFLGGSFLHAVMIQPRVWVFMIGKLLWPAHLSADYTLYDLQPVAILPALVVLLLFLAAQAGLAWKSRIGALGVAIYWLGLATVSNFFPLNHFAADRYYYLPLAGVAFQLCAALLLLRRWPLVFWNGLAVTFLVLIPLTGLTLDRQKIFSSEETFWSETLRVSPQSAPAYSGLGQILADQGRYPEAIVDYRRALEINPDAAEVHNNLGSALSKNGEVDEAIDQFHESLRLNPEAADTHCNLGNALLKQKLHLAAIDEYQIALRLNPNLAEVHNNLAEALASSNRLEEAVAEFRLALKLNPNLAALHFNLGNCLYQLGRDDEALAEYEKALTLDPKEPSAHNNRGFILLKKGRREEAAAEFQEALRLNPDYGDARANLLKAQAGP